MGRKLFLETVGCQMNMLDSELVVGDLRRRGYELVDSPAEADVVLYNTCSVRQHAEDKIYSALGRLAHRGSREATRGADATPLASKRRQIVGVLGCMAQKDQEIIRKRAPHVDIICGPGQLHQLPELIDAIDHGDGPQLAVSLGRADASRHEVERSFESYDALREPGMRPTPYQAFVRTQFGCDKFCTYCIVPSVRGPEQSRPPEQIAAEVRQLIEQGVREVTFVGQTVNSYRHRHGDGRVTRFSDLIALVHDTPGLDRLKFVTNYPKDMSDDLLDAVRELPKVAKYLHVPAQSGCDDMLKRMKRLYTVEFYREMLQRCRERVPGVAVSSDFIVGFCGETEESFQRTCDLVATAGFKNSFIFKYSARPGTKADDLYPDDIPEETKKRRNNDLLAIQNAVSLADHRTWVGRTVDVLVEGPSKSARKHDHALEQLTGRTLTDHIVVFDGPARLTGQLVTIEIEEATAFTLFGRVQTQERVGGSGEFTRRTTPRLGLPMV
jgi:tRNA-2-methylthio-N6-dimethylallyladenosine synthase